MLGLLLLRRWRSIATRCNLVRITLSSTSIHRNKFGVPFVFMAHRARTWALVNTYHSSRRTSISHGSAPTVRGTTATRWPRTIYSGKHLYLLLRCAQIKFIPNYYYCFVCFVAASGRLNQKNGAKKNDKETLWSMFILFFFLCSYNLEVMKMWQKFRGRTIPALTSFDTFAAYGESSSNADNYAQKVWQHFYENRYAEKNIN